MNRFTKGKGLFGSVTLDGGATLKGDAKGNIAVTGYSKTAAGSNGWYYQVEQIDTVALTGTLRAGYFVATNGILAATGTIRGIEVKARAADSSNIGNNVAYLEGSSISVDAKTKNVTRMYGQEIMLDGAAGGTVTTAVGLQISNNASDVQTNSYAIRINQTGGGHKAFTKDIILQNGESIDNATDGTIAFTAGVLKHAFDAAAYWTATQADGGAVTFASVSDGTAGFAFSQKVDITGVLKVLFDAAAYMTITQADAAGVTFASVSDGTPKFTFSQTVDLTAGFSVNTNRFAVAAAGDFTSINQEADATGTTWNLSKSRAAYAACSDNDVIFEMNCNGYNDAGTPVVKLVGILDVLITDVTSGNEDGAFIFKTMTSGAAANEKLRIEDVVTVTNVLKVAFDAAAYMTVTQADTGGITFASVSDGTAGFTFSQVTNFTAGLNINTNYITMLPDATATIGKFNLTGTLAASPGPTVIAHTVNVTHSAGAGDCDDLIASYSKVNVTGAGDAGLTAVGIAARAYLGAGADASVAAQIYGVQAWAKHMGTGTCTAMSGLSAALLLNDAEAFTSTNSINAGHFHLYTVSGAANGAVTSGNFDCVMMEVYPNVTGLQSVLNMAIETAATVGAWFDLNGGADVTNFFDISAVSTCVVIAAGTTMHHDPNAVTCDGHLIIKVGAAQYDIPFYDHS